ncbi:type II secretion system F family protein [Methanococcus voltae]|uniref:Flp pilus assembly protein TadB n=2 Tax=Methanococcus voltae TaxID=2188 RepID=A0A8J7S5X2_METVO|nr:type II secretion system F family protein [Methanococcus voltae]MBP2173246.1 Flp pilus assembly protein TadB [Methanococcus voltae]MBP2202110.1 Flp pilus assembly protein TadB [Methanococcus voltae]MCS3922923.1 Flp pilus assembly protein TadB [Methanococcus voltae PS]
MDFEKLYNYAVRRNLYILKKSGFNITEKNFLIAILLTSFIPLIFKIFLNFSIKSTLILTFMYLFTLMVIPSILYENKIDKFEKNLPKALYIMVLSLNSGRSVIESINEIINSDIKEVNIAFSKIILLMSERKLSFEDSVLIVSNSLDSKLFKQLGRLIIENRKYGGNLAESLSTLAKTLEDLTNLKNQLLSVASNGLSVGIIILCIMIPATAGLVGSFLNLISAISSTATAVHPEQISRTIEIIQIGTGIFGFLVAIPMFGIKLNRMVIMSTVCMTLGILAFYLVYNLSIIIFT